MPNPKFFAKQVASNKIMRLLYIFPSPHTPEFAEFCTDPGHIHKFGAPLNHQVGLDHSSTLEGNFLQEIASFRLSDSGVSMKFLGYSNLQGVV